MEIITELLADWGYAALFIIMVMENMNIPIPSEVVLGFAGFLVSENIFSMGPTILIGTLAGLTGSLLSYWMGAWGGRQILLRFSSKGGLTTKKLIAADSWFQNYGGLAVFTGRLLPGIRTFISLPAGIAKYSLPHFIFFTLLGTLPWTCLLVFVGAELGANWQTLLSYKVELAVGSILVVLLVVALFMFFRKK
jgi:membrane protein DedA with SNARE-associated domain